MLFKSEIFGFDFLYPSDWKIRSLEDEGLLGIRANHLSSSDTFIFAISGIDDAVQIETALGSREGLLQNLSTSKKIICSITDPSSKWMLLVAQDETKTTTVFTTIFGKDGERSLILHRLDTLNADFEKVFFRVYLPIFNDLNADY